MKRLIAIGDIHGEFDLLIELMDKIQFDSKEDTLVFLGDYIDRGKQSKQVVEYVSSLRSLYPNRVILLKGNHEDLATSLIENKNLSTEQERKRQESYDIWAFNGGWNTVESYFGEYLCKEKLIPFIDTLQLSYETDDFIFVHGGIPEGKTLENVTEYDLMWDRTMSYDGRKTLVVGHTPVKDVVISADGKMILVDTGVFRKNGKLSAIDVLSNQIWSVNKEK